MLRHGTTGYLPTTLSWPAPRLARAVEALAEFFSKPNPEGAAPLGIHLEGPWIQPEAAGAQPGTGIRVPDPDELDELIAAASGALRMVTLAPELPGSPALIDRLLAAGIVPALGHSTATAEAVAAAAERGARHVTHLFNAMGPLHHRRPGLAGQALTDDRLTCDVICDGAHVAPALLKLAWRAKPGRLSLITDRLEVPADGADGDSFGAGAVRDDGTAIRFANGQLAGGSVTLDRAARNLRDFAGVPLHEALTTCTLGPARVLGLENERGSLRRGARADFAIVDETGHVTETWLAGRRRYSSHLAASSDPWAN